MNKSLIDQLRRVQSEMVAITTRSELEKRVLNHAERAQYENLQAERDGLLGNIFFCAP